MRKTKIICTIGPASENKETLIAMCKAGMNVARLNFSHGTYPEQQSKIDLIKQVRQELGLPIAIMLDTKGPEYRIRTFESGRITLNEGDDFIFTTDEVEGDQHRVSVNYKHLTENLKTTGFRSVEYKGVSVEILRSTPHVTDSGWIGPDHPSTATEEWGKEMLETTANYIVDFMEEFKKVKLS